MTSERTRPETPSSGVLDPVKTDGTGDRAAAGPAVTVGRALDVAMSGGGIRAALFSGGALLAINQWCALPGARVDKLRAVSGSSLLLGRLIAASHLDITTKEVRTAGDLLRKELELIAKYGFTPSFARSSFLASTFWVGALLALDTTARRHLGDPGFPPWVAVPLGVIIGIAGYQLLRRQNPFSLERTSRTQIVPKDQEIRFDYNATRRCSALPTNDVGFVCTELPSGDPIVLTAHATHHSYGSPLQLYQAVGASAAFPFYSRTYSVGGKDLADGGIVDNLGVSDFQSGTSTNTVLVIDADVPDRTNHAAHTDSWAVAKEYLFLPAGFTVALLLGYGLLDTHADLIGLFFFLYLVFSFRAAIGLSLLVTRSQFRQMSVDVGAIPAAISSQNQLRLEAVRATGRSILKVSLRDRTAGQKHLDAKNMGTRLSPLSKVTSFEIIRTSYEATLRLLGLQADPSTVAWLEDADNQSNGPRRQKLSKARTTLRRVLAFTRQLLFGFTT